MYSFPDLEPVCCSMPRSNCCFLTCIQSFQEADQVVWYSHFLKNFLQFVVIHKVKGFGIGNKVEVDVFLECSCFLYDPRYVGSLISVPLPFVNPAWTFGSSRFTYCWNPGPGQLPAPAAPQWPLLSFPNLLAYWVQHFHSIIFQDLK